MKRILKKPITSLLALTAHLIVRKYQPTVVMVTGSVGKTSTKDALKAVLSERSFVRASEKSYNSEFGVPLTIIGAKNPWTNPVSWLFVFKEALALILLPNHYPKTLVLEVGADRPGDLARILHIALPNAVVVTRLPEIPVHVEAYVTPEAVREEEFVPAYGLAPSAPLIVNVEDVYARTYAKRLPVSVKTFGFKKEADVYLKDPGVLVEKGSVTGMEATVCVGEKEHKLHVRGALGYTQLLAPAAAITTALALHISMTDIFKGMENYVPPAGRSRLLHGKEGSIIIDDTYNSSPAAIEEALGALALAPARRRIAVLGDMLELGRYSVHEHERAGTLAARQADILVAVGVRARTMAQAARAAGMKDESVHICDSAKEAADLLPTIVQEGDAILVKGSQSIRTERIVEALLVDPSDISKLVRQEKEWKRR